MPNTLHTHPLNERPDLVAEPVLAALEKLGAGLGQIRVAEIDPDFSDTESFCEHYGYDSRQTANTVIVEATRAGSSKLAVVVMVAADRADINGVVRKTLDARRVSLAPKDEAVKLSRMEYGSITVIGLPDEWSKLIDARVLEIPKLLMGGGLRRSKLIFPGSILAKLPSAQAIENLARA